MFTAVTHSIQVTVLPEFVAERSSPDTGQYFWTYIVEITNLGEVSVQLLSRHWRITDANGKLEEVRGLGVVGEQPILRMGESFRYTSGCPLSTSSGIMQGIYQMIDDRGLPFDVEIPAFSLDSPFVPRSIN